MDGEQGDHVRVPLRFRCAIQIQRGLPFYERRAGDITESVLLRGADVNARYCERVILG